MDTQILGTTVVPAPKDPATEAVDTLTRCFGDEAGKALASQVLDTGNTDLPPPVQAVYKDLLNGQKQAVDSALVRLFAEGFGRAAAPGGDEQGLKPFIANLLGSRALRALTTEEARGHLPEAARGPMATLGTVLALMREAGAKDLRDPAATVRQIDGLDAKVHALLPTRVRDTLVGLRQRCQQAVDTAKASTKTMVGDPFADAVKAHPAPATPPAAKPSVPPPLPPADEEVEIPTVKLTDPPATKAEEAEPAPQVETEPATKAEEDLRTVVRWQKETQPQEPIAPMVVPMQQGWLDTIKGWPWAKKAVAVAALISFVLVLVVAQVLNPWTGTPTIFAPRATNHLAPPRPVVPTVPPAPSPGPTAAPAPAMPVVPPPTQNALPRLPQGAHAGRVPAAWYATHGAAFDCGNDAVTNSDGTVDMTACGRMPR